MTDITGYKSARDWLEGQNRDVVTVFAVRAALRAWPFLSTVSKNDNFPRMASDIILPLSYGMATALSAGNWPDRAVDIDAAFAAADAAADAATTGAARADAAAARAAFAAADAAAADAAADAADAAAFAASSAAFAAADAADAAAFAASSAAVWQAFKLDVAFIEAGHTAFQLTEEPLWTGGKAGLPQDIQKHWQELRHSLLGLKENWEVWTDWYEARLVGGPMMGGADLEIAKIKSLEKNYKKGAAVANKALSEIIEEYKRKHPQAPPPQDPTAETVGFNDLNEIDFTTSQTSLGILDTPDQRLRYQELRGDAAELLGSSDNLLAKTKPALQKFLNVLPEDMAAAKVVLVSSRGNKLRVLLTRHKRAAEKGDDPVDGPSDAKLDDDVAQELEHIVTTFNKFAFNDSNLRAEDESGADLKDEETEIETLELVRPILTRDLTHLMSGELAITIDDIFTQNQIIGLKPEERLDRKKDRKTISNVIAFLINRADKAKNTLLYKDGELSPERIAANTVIFGALSAGSGRVMEYVSKQWPHLTEMMRILFG